MSVRETFVWALGLMLGATVLLSPAACTMHRHYLVKQAIASGSDPLAARCALPGPFDSERDCYVFSIGKALRQ